MTNAVRQSKRRNSQSSKLFNCTKSRENLNSITTAIINENFKDYINRSALGRNGILGELYDARTENFTSRSLFLSSFPKSFTDVKSTARSEIDYKLIESLNDRFDLLQVEGELLLSVICGLLKIEGSGKFLEEDKKSQKTVSCSLVCKLSTVHEKIFGSFEEILPYIDFSALQDSFATHVVVGVDWGANFLLTLQSCYKSHSQKKEMEGLLMGQLSFFKQTLSAKGQFQKNNINSSLTNNIDIKVYVDVLVDKELPTSVEGFFRFLSDIPNLMKKVNNGKGKPLNYMMIPVEVFKKVAKLELTVDVVVKSIDESFVASTILLLEDIKLLKHQCYDLMEDMMEFQRYIDQNELKNFRKLREELVMKESSLKAIISENLVLVRSGKKSLKDFTVLLENFKKQNLKLHIYEDYYFNLFSSVGNKINEVRQFISLGVKYLGQGDEITNLLENDGIEEFVVLVVSSEFKKKDPDLYQQTSLYFLGLVQNPAPDTAYVVLDLDFRQNNKFLKYELSEVKCFHLKGLDVLSVDMYGEYIFKKSNNFMLVAEANAITLERHKPGNRVLLEMICPGFENGSCSSDALKWHCFQCHTHIEYGFDEFFYCSCGKAPIKAFKFRCCNIKCKHDFIFPRPEFLIQQLRYLKPMKKLNVLILGQSGVGKSTWINSIMNYMTYDSLNAAKEAGVLCRIPVSVVLYPPQVEKQKTVLIGEETSNELFTPGSSATQQCQTYTFPWQGRYVRLIDTPGLGDTRGIQQDKENMKTIINYLGNFEELHAVCILIKANDNRLNNFFSYCIKELFVHLHKSLVKNIVFCFTNSRNSFYAPGKACIILENLLKSLKLENALGLGEYNMFCLENEAFLFLCTMSIPGIFYDERLLESFGQSWEISAKDTKRMFETISSFEPHSINTTLSLVSARYKILTLTEPLAQISKTIQMNLTTIENKKKFLTESNKTLKELTEQLFITEIHLEPTTLDKPRTVCTSPGCVQYYKYNHLDVSEIEYKTICHSECYLKNVEPKTTNNYLLKNCQAIENEVCKVCGCNWSNHMHISFSQKRVEKKNINEAVQKNIFEEKSRRKEVEKFIEFLEEKTEKYKKEQKTIFDISVNFGIFLKNNAISVYNDSIEEYLKHLIDEEEKKLNKTESEENILKSLKETLNLYRTEVRILQEVMNKSSDNNNKMLTPKDIFEMEEKLYNLELTGEEIKNFTDTNRLSIKKQNEYSEVPLIVNTKNFNETNNSKNSKKWFQVWK